MLRSPLMPSISRQLFPPHTSTSGSLLSIAQQEGLNSGTVDSAEDGSVGWKTTVELKILYGILSPHHPLPECASENTTSQIKGFLSR